MPVHTSSFGTRPSQPFDLRALGHDWEAAGSGSDASSSGGAYAVYKPDIEQSPNDKRAYRLIRLENGLEALLVSDPTLDKAAASLSVGIGHLSDPDDLPGLAHFCEHLLFMGTEKFPDEAEYKTFLSQNAGSSNAYTSIDETNYHFTCHPTAIAGALERHSQFFVAPLFLASCTERELNAVDSEFRRNLMLDSRRLFQLGKATSSHEPGSTYWKFGTGSKETLWETPVANGVDVRERLLEWYSANYSSNLMKLSILSTQPLDELTALTIANYAAVPNLNLAPPRFDVPAISTKEAQTLVSYRTIKDTPQLRLEFPFEDQTSLWQTQPGRYISHLVGHESEGSILATLKERGWANSLSSSSGGGAFGFDFFRISVELTASGLEHYQEVLQVIFAYIKIASEQGIQQWIHDETVSLGQISWRWKEHGQPASIVQSLSSGLQAPLPPSKTLIGRRFATHFDADLIAQAFAQLHESRCRVLLGSKDPLSGKAWNDKEQYYSTEYSISPLELLPPASYPKLYLPTPNPFVPSHLDLVPRPPNSEPNFKRPSLIRKTSTSRLFYKLDTTWLVPRARAHFLLKTPLANHTPLAAVSTQIFTDLVEEELADTTYDATLAGLHFSVGTHSEGLEVVVTGYSEKLHVLLEVVLKKMKATKFDSTRFAIVHERLRRAYANAALNNPSSTADHYLRHLLSQTHWTHEESLEAFKDIHEVSSHATALLRELQLESLVHGNITKADAVAMVKLAETTLGSAPADPAKNDFHRSLILKSGTNLVYRTPVPSAENVNSAAILYYQVGHSNDRDLLVRLYLFAQLSKVHVFSTLRTKEQLGYIVQSSARLSRGMAGFRVVVQSERTGEYLDGRIEAMWDDFGAVLNAMTDAEFAEQRQSLVNQKKEMPKNMGQETSRYWVEIESGEFDFSYREREAEAISKLTRDDMKHFFTTYIQQASPLRTKLAILVKSQRLQPSALAAVQEALVSVVDPDGKAAAEAFCSSKPTREAVQEFVGQQLGKNPPLSVADELERLDATAALPAGTVEVAERESFRKSLAIAERPSAVDDFESDLASHL